ncbi:hypothetical protein JY718_18140 [Clostridioides difficile]|nr:hypothetical protein [Clostridioides difficile]
MDNGTVLEAKELLQRLVEAVEELNAAPQWDTIISLLALIASWITIAFLLKERKEKNRPYLEISFELVRSTLACIVLRNTGSCPLEIKSLRFSDTFTNQLSAEVQTRLKNKEETNIAIFPNRQWVISFDVNVFDILGDFEEKKVTICYVYSKTGTHKKKYKEDITIDFEEYKGILDYISDLDEFKRSVDKLNKSIKKYSEVIQSR